MVECDARYDQEVGGKDTKYDPEQIWLSVKVAHDLDSDVNMHTHTRPGMKKLCGG